MQLSLVDEIPEFKKDFFLDVFAEAVFVPGKKDSVKLLTIDGQQVPQNLKVSCPNKFIRSYPEGTIYKLDTKLVRKDGKKPYFIAVNRKNVQRALEFFEYNLKVQHGFDYVPPTKRNSVR